MGLDTNKAILIGVCLDSKGYDKKVSSLEELERLADTAGVEIVGKYIQKRRHVDKRTYAGKGFLADAVAELQEQGGGLIIFDNELSPTQGRNIEKVFEVEVSDRTEVILDIFHNHARTKEARLQVKLAELEYQLPRLKRLWGHLDREKGQASGSGGTSRGMGEKQIEIDKRLIKEDIAKVKKDLRKIEQQKQTQRKQRENIKKLCLVGYTNAGKSTLFNRLTDAGVLVEDKLFATLETTTRKLELEKGQGLILSDTVGFISNLPHHLVSSFRATLKDVEDADLLLHVIDSSDQMLIHYIAEVRKVLKKIGAEDIPQILVLNKADKADAVMMKFLLRAHENSLMVSARTGENIETLLQKIDDFLFSANRHHLLIPHSQQRIVNLLHELAVIEKKEYTEDGLMVTAIINSEDMREFERFVVEK